MLKRHLQACPTRFLNPRGRLFHNWLQKIIICFICKLNKGTLDSPAFGIADAKRLLSGLEHKVGSTIGIRRIVRYAPPITIALSSLLHISHYLCANQIAGRLSVFRNKGIKIDQMPDPFRQLFGHAGNYHPSIAAAAENNLLQIFIAQHISYIVDMRLQIDIWTGQMNPLAGTR